MQISQELQRADRTSRPALVAMATELNLDLLVAAWASTCRPTSSPNDMVVAIEADDDAAVAAAVDGPRRGARADGRPRSSGLGDGVPPPPTVAAARRRATPTWP